MIALIHHIRKIVLTASLLLAVVIYLYVTQTYNSENLERIRLGQFYAIAAISYLYVALLASPLTTIFPKLPYKPIYIRARRAIGVSAFFFATLHAAIEFFFLLGGFHGLSLLPNTYLQAITLSFVAYLILALMASTSFDWAVKKLGTRWKMLHRLVYIAAFLIVLHALMLGTHFTDLSELIPKIFFAALSILLFLEALRFDRFLASKLNLNFSFGISLIFVAAFLAYLSFYLKPPTEGSGASLGIHANHIKLAEEAQSGKTSSDLPSNIPGLDGDRTKRYTMTFNRPEQIATGEDVELSFEVFDASNGTVSTVFKRPYEQPFHLIIVDNSLNYFNHIHPTQKGSKFLITTSFPKAGTYHLYADTQPLGGIEQQMAFSLTVGETKGEVAKQEVDKNFTKTFGDYEVTLSTSGTLRASEMSLGKQKISFTIKNAKTGEPVKDLKPYLNAFGHLVMIKQDTFEYLHVHPYDLKIPQANANGGPTVEFLPIGIYGAFKSGVYRVFGQFNHNGKLFVADFTVEVK